VTAGSETLTLLSDGILLVPMQVDHEYKERDDVEVDSCANWRLGVHLCPNPKLKLKNAKILRIDFRINHGAAARSIDLHKTKVTDL